MLQQTRTVKLTVCYRCLFGTHVCYLLRSLHVHGQINRNSNFTFLLYFYLFVFNFFGTCTLNCNLSNQRTDQAFVAALDAKLQAMKQRLHSLEVCIPVHSDIIAVGCAFVHTRARVCVCGRFFVHLPLSRYIYIYIYIYICYGASGVRAQCGAKDLKLELRLCICLRCFLWNVHIRARFCMMRQCPTLIQTKPSQQYMYALITLDVSLFCMLTC